MLALVWLGIVLRSRGVWFGRTIPLWEDEAAWAIGLIEKPLSEHVIRAPGFMALSKLLVSVFSASEATLRFLPWCAGVGSMLVAPFVATRLCRSVAAQLVFVGVLALHPGAIDLSKEFKPYSIALLLHLLLLLFVLRYVQDGKEHDLNAGIGFAFFGVLFSHDVVFAYPMVFGVMAFSAYRADRRSDLLRLGVGAAASIALLVAFHMRIASGLGDMDKSAQYWGSKYDVFYVHGQGQGGSRLGWTAARFYELAGMLGMRQELWTSSRLSASALGGLKSFDHWVWATLCAAGFFTLLYQRRVLHLVLVVVPLVVLTGFNYFGYWPLGAFRTNLFTLAYCAALAACAFEWKLALTPGYWELLPTFLLVMLPFLTIGRSNHARKESSFSVQTAFTQATEELLRLQEPGGRAHNVLALDDKSCHPWRYYTQYHPDKVRENLAQRFDARCGKSLKGMTQVVRRGLKSPESRAFMLAAGDQMNSIGRSLPKDLRIVSQKFLGHRDALVVSVALQAN